MTVAAPARPGQRRTWTLLLTLFLVGLNLRTTMASVPPLLGEIERDLHLNGVRAGLLTSLPILCMGIFAPVAHRLAARVGRANAVSGALGLLSLGLLMRLGGASLPVLYAGTLLAGTGIAVVGTVLPGVVKSALPARAGAATAAYSAAMVFGAALSSGFAVPGAAALGSWQRSLAVWAVPAAAALAVWLGIEGRRNDRCTGARNEIESTAGLPWHSRTARLLSAYLAVQSTVFYSCLAWVAPSYSARGWDGTDAGLLLAVFSAVQIVSTVAAPVAADRFRDRRPLFLLAGTCSGLGILALVLAPELAPFLLVALLGFGQGAAFALGLVLLVDYAPDPHDSGRLSAMAFLVCYLVSAWGPALFGALRDATGGFRTPFALLLLLVAAQLLLVTRLAPGRRL